MKEQIRSINFQQKTRELINEILNILKNLEAQGINRVTVRQLFYQLVTKGVIENKLSQYLKVSAVLTNARYCGLIDWNSVVDESSYINLPNTFDDINELIDTAVQSYKLDRWKNQEYYIELWCEKKALLSVLEPVIRKYQIPCFVPGGRISATDIYKSVRRFKSKVNEGFRDNNFRHCIVLYIGDYDPCGLDMALRDIPKRLKELCDDLITIIPIALTKEQTEGVPTDQITKRNDTNRGWFEEHTCQDKCWEVDALEPQVLQKIIEKNVLKYLDIKKFNILIKQEQDDIEELKEKMEVGK